MTSATSTPAPPPRPRALGGRGGSSPPRRRPNSSDRRRLKLRHSSSRSGGPWLPPPGPPLGPSGPREPRPQLESFKDMWLVSLEGERVAPRGCPGPGEFCDGIAQQLESRARARAHEYAGNPTILVALDCRFHSRGVDLVPDQKARRRSCRNLGQHPVDRQRL